MQQDTPMISGFGRWGQEGQEFKVTSKVKASLSYVRPHFTTPKRGREGGGKQEAGTSLYLMNSRMSAGSTYATVTFVNFLLVWFFQKFCLRGPHASPGQHSGADPVGRSMGELSLRASQRKSRSHPPHLPHGGEGGKRCPFPALPLLPAVDEGAEPLP